MNAFQTFIAARAAKAKQPVVNADTPVTRAEFNTLANAVAGLIEDFDAVASPEKIQAVLNAAVEAAAKEPVADARKPLALPVDEVPVRNAAKSGARPPLALPGE